MDLAPFTFPDDMTLEEYEFYRPARPLPQYMPPGEDKIEEPSSPDTGSQNASL
jgi:hypothetical protein